MKKTIIFLGLLLFFGSLNASIQICNSGHCYGIIYDNTEWGCVSGDRIDSKTVISNHSLTFLKSYTHYSNGYIQGSSKSVPLTFVFFDQNYNASYKMYGRESEVLSKYAVDSTSVISNVKVEGYGNDRILTACFFDNQTSGYIMILYKDNYVMFVEMRTDLFDEQTRNLIMKKPYELIQLLYNPNKSSRFDFDDLFVEIN